MNSTTGPSIEAGAAAQPARGVLTTETAESPCPYCFGPVVAAARKCRHCGEFLDDQLRDATNSTQSTSITSGTVTESDLKPAQSGATNLRLRKLSEIQKLLILAVVFSAAGTLQHGSKSVWVVTLFFSGLGLADTFLRPRKTLDDDAPTQTPFLKTMLLATLFALGLVGLTMLNTALFPETDPQPATYDNIYTCVGPASGC